MNVVDFPLIAIPWRRGKYRIPELTKFSQQLQQISERIGFKLSSRGWCYQLEGCRYREKNTEGQLDKGQFNRIQKLINECIKKGVLSPDFLADEEAREFDCVNNPTGISPAQFMANHLRSLQRLEKWYEPDYWIDEEVYIQMLVEKVDLKTLFHPICDAYHVPIATSKGWSSVKQRIKMGSRFKIAEEKGLTPVLLNCGDHDPYGYEISNLLKKHFEDLESATGWSPDNLIIDRFGLNYDFICEHNLTWIDNLVSGSGKQPDFDNPIIKRYVDRFGVRKVEANAIVVIPDIARELCKSAIEKYTGPDILQRFESKEIAIASEFNRIRSQIMLDEFIDSAMEILFGE
jgi:hypothetical protein